MEISMYECYCLIVLLLLLVALRHSSHCVSFSSDKNILPQDAHFTLCCSYIYVVIGSINLSV